jgi:hypothetical protein
MQRCTEKYDNNQCYLRDGHEGPHANEDGLWAYQKNSGIYHTKSKKKRNDKDRVDK